MIWVKLLLIITEKFTNWKKNLKKIGKKNWKRADFSNCDLN